jgi:hypothetical protein
MKQLRAIYVLLIYDFKKTAIFDYGNQQIIDETTLWRIPASVKSIFAASRPISSSDDIKLWAFRIRAYFNSLKFRAMYKS